MYWRVLSEPRRSFARLATATPPARNSKTSRLENLFIKQPASSLVRKNSAAPFPPGHQLKATLPTRSRRTLAGIAIFGFFAINDYTEDLRAATVFSYFSSLAAALEVAPGSTSSSRTHTKGGDCPLQANELRGILPMPPEEGALADPNIPSIRHETPSALDNDLRNLRRRAVNLNLRRMTGLLMATITKIDRNPRSSNYRRATPQHPNGPAATLRTRSRRTLARSTKKGRYVYYHGTGYRGKCPERYTREEILENQFAGRLHDVIPPEVIN